MLKGAASAALFNVKNTKNTLNMIKFKSEKKIFFQFFYRKDGHSPNTPTFARS